MLHKITVSDYDFDWALKERNVHPRTKPGYLTREEVIAFCGSLGVPGIELNHSYWDDYDASRLKELAANAGLLIVTYVGFADLAIPPSGRRGELDEVFAFLDRTCELGASNAFLVSATYKQEFSLEEQRAWLIEGLREASEHASSLGLTILSENIDYPPTRPLMGRGADCRHICDAVGSAAFRPIYDVAAPIFVNEDSLETLSEMRPYVAHVHLKNYRPLPQGEQTERFLDANDGRRFTGTTLDAGIVPIEPIVAQLSRLGYEGFLQIEYQGEEDPRIALKHNIQYLREILESTV